MKPEPRILALGCAGAMGRMTVQTLIGSSRFAEIQVADRDIHAAQSFVRSLSQPHVKAIHVDITDPKELQAALTNADIVISTVGPYYRFGTTVLKAAIETGTHYLDICDDWQPTVHMLQLNEEAKKAGVTAIIGAGASPGISNLLAVKAADELDQVDVLHTMWGSGSRRTDNNDTEENSAALYHWLAMLTGKIKIFRNQSWTMNAPMERIPIDYPGIGRVYVHTLGHPEPISLPMRYPELKESVNAMDLPKAVIAILRRISKKIDRSSMSLEDGVHYVGKLFTGSDDMRLGDALNEAFRSAWNNSAEMLGRKKYLPPIAAYATGVQNGRSLRVGASLQGVIPGGMPAVTGIPTAVMTDMLISGEITQHGVYAPEIGVDPDIFFRKLAPFTTRPDLSSQPVKIVKAA